MSYRYILDRTAQEDYEDALNWYKERKMNEPQQTLSKPLTIRWLLFADPRPAGEILIKVFMN